MTNFIRWQIIVGVLFCVSLVLVYYDIFQTVFKDDVTYLTNLIGGLFLFQTFNIGHYLFKGNFSLERASKVTKSIRFISRIVLSLGMLGTVAGFVYMLDRGMASLNFHDNESVIQVFKMMAQGMATALWTTLYGLIASILLSVQMLLIKTDVR